MSNFDQDGAHPIGGRLVSMNMVRGLGGRNAPDVDGCRESEVSLRGIKHRYVCMVRERLNATP